MAIQSFHLKLVLDTTFRTVDCVLSQPSARHHVPQRVGRSCRSRWLNLYAFLCQHLLQKKNAKTAKPPWEEPALGKSLGRCQWPWCLCILQVLYVMISCDKCAPMGEKNSSQYPRSVAKTLWKSEGSLFLQGSDLAKLGLDPLSMLSGVSQCTRATPPHPGRISKCFNMK